MRSSFFWDDTQRILVVSFGRFGTTYPYHLQGSRSPRSVHWYVSTFRDNLSVPSSKAKQSHKRKLVRTDVSGQTIGSIFKGQKVQESWTAETSVTTNQRCVTSQKSEDLLLAYFSCFMGTDDTH